MARSAEVEQKLATVRELLGGGLDAVVLRGPGAVAWLSGGGRTHIEATAAVGVASVVVTPDAVRVVTAVNEAARLAEEELAALDAEWDVRPWTDGADGAGPRGAVVGSDVPSDGETDLSGPLEELRRGLTAEEVDRYRTLARDAAEAMTEACSRVLSTTSEQEAAARLGGALLARGLDPMVLLAAGSSRLPRHRHPLPTDAPAGDLLMLVACARRHGLVANLTRFVAPGRLAAEHAEVYPRLLQVEAAYLSGTRPGARVGDVVQAGVAAYAGHGFAAEEWTRHHQGGPTGYATREWLATPTSSAAVVARQAFAWNPSVPSLKVEDTVLAGGSPEEAVEVLTVDPGWPTTRVDGRDRPDVLELG